MASRRPLTKSPSESRQPVDPSQFVAAAKRLEEQLQLVKEQSQKLEERSRQYDEVRELLVDLPEKVQHPIMVPFGPLAFFEGHLEHTGEVLTQLSSEWFALRTTKHAVGMCDRRREQIKEDRQLLVREREQLEQRHRVARQEAGQSVDDPVAKPAEEAQTGDEGFVDIREPYVEDGRSAKATSMLPPDLAANVQVDNDGYLEIREPLEEEQEMSPGRPSVSSSSARSRPVEDVNPCGGRIADDVVARMMELERLEELEDSEEGAVAASEPSVAARMRELERLEEMQELDDICERAERWEGGAALDEAAGQAASESRRATQEVSSPADLQRIMQCVEEAAAGGFKPSRPFDVAEAAGLRPFLEEASPRGQPGATGSPGPGAAAARASKAIAAEKALPGYPPPGAGAFNGEIRERSVGNAVPASSTGASAAEPAPKRVSRFKAERQRGFG
eukprot:TRINITY_DN8163_c0_g1_i1.p1 TRINITY_DN8163_c0_g1~~TRINITY_DN8163_c0_g1_i1.p1  ORF type:complete len:448 (+),score=138.65 TRINITY_DN8163_c0_g1_i1:70-1413(+)